LLSVNTYNMPYLQYLTFLEKVDFIYRQRKLKSASFSGNVHIACKLSGKITIASILNGCACLTIRKASRNISTCSMSSFCLRSANNRKKVSSSFNIISAIIGHFYYLLIK